MDNFANPLIAWSLSEYKQINFSPLSGLSKTASQSCQFRSVFSGRSHSAVGISEKSEAMTLSLKSPKLDVF